MAGHEHVHKGLTSRDLTERGQLQIRRSLEIFRPWGGGGGAAGRAGGGYRDLIMAGRSLSVFQATTLSKQFASAAEMMIALRRLGDRTLRGIKGPWAPVRTCHICWAVTVADLSGASPTSWALQLFSSSVGQVASRSLDHDVVSALVQLGAGRHHANTIRLMAGHELATGVSARVRGLSAMPHKVNTPVRTGQQAAGCATSSSWWLG